MTKVIYILGSGRNGSTILANLLGSYPGVVSVGEMYYLWDRGFVENRLCGCGEEFLRCEFWREVVEQADIGPAVARRGLELRRATARTRNAVRPARRELVEEFRALLERIYTAVCEVAGAELIVDSSKVPVYGRVLDGVESVGLQPVLLVRDPRAVVYSWSTPKPDPASPRGEMRRINPMRASAMWTTWNALALRYWHDVLSVIRYEDFVRSPQSLIRELLSQSGIQGIDHPPGVEILSAHTVSGNPVRFTRGPVTIEPDERWREGLPAFPRVVATVLTSPLRGRFGYPMWSSDARS